MSNVASALVMCRIWGVYVCVCVCVCVCEREFCSILHLRWYLLCCVVFGGQKGLNFRVHKKKKSEPLQQGSF